MITLKSMFPLIHMVMNLQVNGMIYFLLQKTWISQGIDLDSASHSLQSPFMGWYTLSIQNDPRIPLNHTSSDDKPEEVIFKVFEYLVYHIEEK